MKTEIEFLRRLEDDLLEVARRQPARQRARAPRRRPPPGLRWVAGAAAVLVLAGGVGYVATRPDVQRLRGYLPNTAATPTAAPGPARAGKHTSPEAFDRFNALVPARAAFPNEAAGDVPLVGPQVVKTATLSVVVPRGTFADAFRDATLVAARYGGFVEASSTRGADSRAGKLVIRVPAASFERALADLRGLGRVDGESTEGVDVTSQYVDLQARIRIWEAQEAVLLRLLRRATTVEGSLRVHRELQEVQLRIEQLEGQLRVLRDQTEMGTISLSVREAGVPDEAAATQGDGPNLAEAWNATVDGFLGVLFTVLVGLGYLVPIAGVLAVLWFAWRRLRGRVVA